MEKKFEDILKGTVWENISDYLYRSLSELAENRKKFPVRESLQHKIDLCNRILACSTILRIKIGKIELTKEQSILAKNAIKEILITEYKNLGMDKVLISTDEALGILKMGVDDDWVREYYMELEMNGEECYLINYNFISRHIDAYVADFYVDYLMDKSLDISGSDCPKFGIEHIENDICCLKYALSLLPKGRPQNITIQNAVGLFFERACDKTNIVDESYVTFCHPFSKYAWVLYHPHTNEEYLTIYRCLDYFNLINQDIKDNWKRTYSKYQEQSYIKKIVSMQKKKYPMNSSLILKGGAEMIL